MDDFTATVRSVVGMPTEQTWAQAFSYESLFGVVSISGENTASLSIAGRDFLETLEREYVNLPVKNLVSLDAMISLIVKRNATLDLCLVLAVCVGRVLYLFGRGGGQAILCRSQKLGTVLSPDSAVTSGLLESGDTLILFTKRFSTLVSFEQIKKSLDHLSPDAICDVVAPLVSEESNNGLAACLVVRFEKRGAENSYFDNLTLQQSEEASVTPHFVLLGNFLGKGRSFLFAGKKRVLASFFSLSEWLNGFFSPRIRRVRQRVFRQGVYFRAEEGTVSLPRNIYIRQRDEMGEKSRQTLLTVGFLLVILLLASAAFGINKRQKEEKLAVFTNLYNLSDLKYNDGKALLTLNPIRARTLLGESKKTAEEAKVIVLKEKVELARVEALLKNINEAMEGISGVYRLSDASLFFDLSVVKEKGVGSRLSLNNKRLAVLDSVNNSVYTIGLERKNAEIIAGGVENFTNSKFISLHGEYAYVFSDRGVMEVNIPAKSSKLVLKKDDGWGEIGALSEFGAFKGNIYLLDKTNSWILKYTSTESSFSATKGYLAGEVKPSFSSASSMAIDGSVWILFAEGKISRYTSGRPDFFALTGLDTPFSSPTVLYTDEESKNLYVLDQGNKRIVVVDKDKKLGEYMSQYIWKELGIASDFVVDEVGKKIYVLSGSKIFYIDLR